MSRCRLAFLAAAVIPNSTYLAVPGVSIGVETHSLVQLLSVQRTRARPLSLKGDDSARSLTRIGHS